MKFLVFAALLVLANALQRREPMGMPPVSETAFIEHENGHELICKFNDNIRARSDSIPQSALSITARHAVTLTPQIDLEDDLYLPLIKRAEVISGMEQPDLRGIYRVEIPLEDWDKMVEVGQELQDLPEMEYCEIALVDVPNPVYSVEEKLVPVSERPEQGYMYANPGVDAMYTLQLNHTGQGLQWKDVEYAWRHTHWEFPQGLNPEPGQTPARPTCSDHGTACASIAVSAVFGERHTQGIVPQATPGVYTEFSTQSGGRRPAAITSAASRSNVGDVIILEMQTSNPYVAAEYTRSVYDATRVATSAGVIVLAANGNGNANMDGGNYNEWMSRPNSLAIFVGAGTSTTAHSKLSFSSYGTRSNIQCWGQNVYTAGYGNIRLQGTNQDYWYTATFSGTSSATAICGPAALAVQSFTFNNYGQRLLPVEMRDLLIRTGTPQGTGGHIGPHANVRAACADVEASVREHGLEWFETYRRKLEKYF